MNPKTPASAPAPAHVTVLGSFNMDLVIEVPRFPSPGEALHGRNFQRACGGKGANQAFALARLGCPSRILGAVGADAFGDAMLANLQRLGVDTTAVLRRADVASGTALILLDATGQNQIVVANGANDTVLPADLLPHVGAIRNSRALVTQLETPTSGVQWACEVARDAGVPVLLNPAPYAPVTDALLQCCRFIIPNEGEATLLTGIPVNDPDSAARAAAQLRQRAPGAEVLVTLGRQGVWIDGREFTGHVPAVPVRAVDTVGAGDTFIGAFTTRWLEGAGVLAAARFGCQAAAIAVTRRGAQDSIPTRAEVDAALATAG